MIVIRPATYKDVENVVDRVSMISGEEMIKCGVDTAWKALGRAKMCKDSGHLDVGCQDGLELCLIGGVKVGNEFRTWFVASEDYWKAGLSVVKATRRYMERLQKANPHFRIVSGSLSDHPRVESWFKMIGFELEKATEEGKVFVFKGRDVTSEPDDAKAPA